MTDSHDNPVCKCGAGAIEENTINIKLSLDGYEDFVETLDATIVAIENFVNRVNSTVDNLAPIAKKLSEVLQQFSWIFDKDKEEKE